MAEPADPAPRTARRRRGGFESHPTGRRAPCGRLLTRRAVILDGPHPTLAALGVPCRSSDTRLRARRGNSQEQYAQIGDRGDMAVPREVLQALIDWCDQPSSELCRRHSCSHVPAHQETNPHQPGCVLSRVPLVQAEDSWTCPRPPERHGRPHTRQLAHPRPGRRWRSEQQVEPEGWQQRLGPGTLKIDPPLLERHHHLCHPPSSLRRPISSTSRRRTGGEHPDTGWYRTMPAGIKRPSHLCDHARHGPALLAFTRQRPNAAM